MAKTVETKEKDLILNPQILQPPHTPVVPVFYCATYNKKFKEKVNFTAPDLTHTCDPNKYCGNYPLSSHRHVNWFKKKVYLKTKTFKPKRLELFNL